MSTHPSRVDRRRTRRRRTSRPERLIDSLDRAIEALKLIVTVPAKPEIIAMLIDENGIGRSMIVIDGTNPGNETNVVDVITTAAEQAGARDSLVLASVRPGGGLESEDCHRWFELDDAAHERGCELIEWLVLDGRRHAYLPRALVGAPERWPARPT